MKTFNEIRGIEEGMTTGKETGMMFKVSVEGLPDMIMVGRSPGQIKSLLRKIVKQPSMINDVQRMPRAKVKKLYRDLGAGKETEENVEEEKINEVSKGKALKYIDYATKHLYHLGQRQGAADTIRRAGGEHPDQDYEKGPERKAAKRIGGIDRATKILMKDKKKKLPDWGTPESTKRAKKQTPGEKN